MHISNWSKTDGQWYLGVLCGKCHAPILFALDRSEGNPQSITVAKLVLTCSQADCRFQADYSMATFSRFKK